MVTPHSTFIQFEVKFLMLFSAVADIHSPQYTRDRNLDLWHDHLEMQNAYFHSNHNQMMSFRTTGRYSLGAYGYCM